MDFSYLEKNVNGESYRENPRKSEKVTNGKKCNISNSNSNWSSDHGHPATQNHRFPIRGEAVVDSESPGTQNPMTEISIDDPYHQKTLSPHPQLPKLEPPRGRRVSLDELLHPPEKFTVDMMRFIRQSGNAISKRLSFLKEDDDDSKKVDDEVTKSDVTEFKISGVKVLVKLKSEEEIRGRITFFSRSNCRDSTAVRLFLREQGFDFSEINIDVYTEREKELIERTGSSHEVPQIFFNEKHFGGLMALNSLRNSGEFDRRIKELLKEKCSPWAFGQTRSNRTEEPEVFGFRRFGIIRKLTVRDNCNQ